MLTEAVKGVVKVLTMSEGKYIIVLIKISNSQITPDLIVPVRSLRQKGFSFARKI